MQEPDASLGRPDATDDAAPSFLGTVADQTHTVGDAVLLTLPSATGGNGLLNYTLEPTIPGLTFDKDTMTLGGTPTMAGGLPNASSITSAEPLANRARRTGRGLHCRCGLCRPAAYFTRSAPGGSSSIRSPSMQIDLVHRCPSSVLSSGAT